MRRAAEGAVLALVTLASLAVSEALVRRFAPQVARIQTPGMYERDSATTYRLTPNYNGVIGNRVEFRTMVRTDERGLRISASGSRSRRPRRVLVLGDSFVFGYGVEADDALPLQLERALERLGDSVSVLNAGIPGYATTEEASWLAANEAALAPDLVIVGVFLGNDLQDNRVPAVARFNRGPLVASRRRWHSPISEWAGQSLHLYTLLRGLNRLTAHRGESADASVSGFIRKYRPPDDRVFREEVNRTSSALARIAQMDRAEGARTFVVLIPESFQVDPAKRALLRRVMPDSIRLDMDQPNRVMARMLDSLSIPWTDLTPALRAGARDGSPLYYPIDGHWTTAGNVLAARVVADAIRRQHTSPPVSAGGSAK